MAWDDALEQDGFDEAETLEVKVMEMSKAKPGTEHPDALRRMANVPFTNPFSKS